VINNKNIKDYIANQVLFEDIRVGERFFTTTQDGISQWIRISRGVYTKCVPSGDEVILNAVCLKDGFVVGFNGDDLVLQGG